MNQVQLLKSRFEKLNSEIVESPLDVAPLRAKSEPPAKFARSVTCIDFSKLRLDEVNKKEPVKEDEPVKPQFQRQLSNSSNSSSSYKSIRRSPAFRFDAQARPSVVKSLTKEVPVKKKIDVDEIEYLSTSATIKKALLKPLPTGSPPKKPPRAFLLSPQMQKKEASPEPQPQPQSFRNQFQKFKINPNTLPKKAIKTEDKKAISSFLNCIISPCSIDPIYYEQIRNERSGVRNEEEEESIYMEPYGHLKRDFKSSNSTPKATNDELHYMCTVLDPSTTDVNGNSSKDDEKDFKTSSLEGTELEDYEKVRFTRDYHFALN